MNQGNKRILLALAAVGIAGGAAVLYWFPPGTVKFYPRCLFHEVTGWNCPGCGTLRALHQLLHGHLMAALALNPLIIVVLPMLGWFALAEGLRATTGRELSHPFKHAAWVWLLAVVVIVFGIVRNLPFGPLAALSP